MKTTRTLTAQEKEMIRILKGYSKVLNQLAKEIPEHGCDQSFLETLSGIGSKLLFKSVSHPFLS